LGGSLVTAEDDVLLSSCQWWNGSLCPGPKRASAHGLPSPSR